MLEFHQWSMELIKSRYLLLMDWSRPSNVFQVFESYT